jgi:hypothetical protein
MGRQIQLSILPADANDLIGAIGSRELVEVAARSGNSAEPQPLQSIPDDFRDLVLWSRRFAPTLKRRYIAAANPPYYLADEQTEPILEFSISVLTKWEGIPALTQGRIYGVFDAKPPEFEKWYERIVRYIRKNWRKNPISWMGGYVGPAASEWFDSGGLLLPTYVPPATSDWLRILGEQRPIPTTKNLMVVPGERVKLSTHINELVRFKLHELTDMKEGVIRAIDQHGYWIEGGTLAEYLKDTSPGADAQSKVQFIEFKRIHWMQRA